MIFKNELTSLESELSQLEMMILAKRQELGFFKNLQSQADECLDKLSRVVNHAKQNTAMGAIASLKTAVLILFDSDGGNQPTTPTPTPDGDERDVAIAREQVVEETLTESLTCDEEFFNPGSIIADADGSFGIVIGGNNLGMRVDWVGLGEVPSPASGKGIWYDWEKDEQAIASFKPATHDRVNLLTTEELLQFLDWDKDQLDDYWDGKWFDVGSCCSIRWGGATASRWLVVVAESCDWASPFASPLACLLWEDAPLLGQHCTVTLEDNKNKGTTDGETMPFVELVKVSDAIAYQRKHDGEIVCCYFGFRTKAHAQSWLHFFEAVTSKVELRQAQRIESAKWEIKAKGLNINQIERYARDCDFSKSYRSEVCSAKPPGYKKPEPPQPVNPDEVEAGDIITPLLTPGDSYEVIQVMPNGILDCKSLRTGVNMGLRPTAVSLVRKATKYPPCPFNEGDLVDWKGCILRVAAIGVETLHCVLRSDPDGTKPHTRVAIAECIMVDDF